MSLDEYSEPKGAYYTPALVATFASAMAAEGAIASLRAAGFQRNDINVARNDDGINVVVSSADTALLGQARGLLTASDAREVHPYGSGSGTL